MLPARGRCFSADGPGSSGRARAHVAARRLCRGAVRGRRAARLPLFARCAPLLARFLLYCFPVLAWMLAAATCCLPLLLAGCCCLLRQATLARWCLRTRTCSSLAARKCSSRWMHRDTPNGYQLHYPMLTVSLCLCRMPFLYFLRLVLCSPHACCLSLCLFSPRRR